MTRLRPLIVEEFTRLEALPPEPPDVPMPPEALPEPPDVPLPPEEPAPPMEPVPWDGAFRLATAADIPAIVRMGLACFQHRAYAGLLPEPDHLAWEARRLLAMGVCYLADTAEGPVGMAGAVLVPSLQNGQAIAVSTMWWVDPAGRGHGLGHRLLHLVKAWAVAQHATAFHVAVPAGDPGMTWTAMREGFQMLETVWHQVLPRAEGA